MSAVPEITWDEFVKVCDELYRATTDLRIAEDALEAERQWRLTSLPALLAAEERANRAEAEVARLLTRDAEAWRDSVVAANPHMKVDAEYRQFPELRQTKRHTALINAYHQSTNEERP